MLSKQLKTKYKLNNSLDKNLNCLNKQRKTNGQIFENFNCKKEPNNFLIGLDKDSQTKRQFK